MLIWLPPGVSKDRSALPATEHSYHEPGCLTCGRMNEQCLNHRGVTPWPTNNRMEQRSVPAKAIGIDDCARIDIGAVREQPVEDLPFSEINRDVQQCRSRDRRPVHA